MTEPNKTIKRTSVMFGVAMWLVGLTLYFELSNEDARRLDKNIIVNAGQLDSTVPLGSEKLTRDDEETPTDPLVSSEYETYKTTMIQQLLARYRDNISDIGVQASLKEFQDYVHGAFPDVGHSLFKDIINTAFPDQAQSIFSVLARLSEYQEWHLDNMLSLNDMTALEKEGRIWGKRHELFGDDAELIWSKEISDRQARQTAMQQSIEVLDKAYDTTMDERLYRLQNSIEEQYSTSLENLVIDKGLVSGVFFGFDSVQQDLKSMTPEDRQQQINTVRRQLGYTEEQISRMAVKDNVREQRWAVGNQYLKEKAELEGKYSGSELAAEVRAIQTHYFKNEASTIALEEKSGFFRFERPRLYGRN